jgi:hypothetical protein
MSTAVSLLGNRLIHQAIITMWRYGNNKALVNILCHVPIPLYEDPPYWITYRNLIWASYKVGVLLHTYEEKIDSSASH